MQDFAFADCGRVCGVGERRGRADRVRGVAWICSLPFWGQIQFLVLFPCCSLLCCGGLIRSLIALCSGYVIERNAKGLSSKPLSASLHSCVACWSRPSRRFSPHACFA